MIKTPSIEWLGNPEIFRVNRIDAHSDHLYYEKKDDIKLGYDMPLRQCLNGKWRFSYAVNQDERIKDFYRDDYDCSDFDYINVPGHIQLQGYDKCQYINTMYPWDGHDELRPPHISKTYNPVCHSLLQWILTAQGLNLGLPYCRQIFYHLNHGVGPHITYNSHI